MPLYWYDGVTYPNTPAQTWSFFAVTAAIFIGYFIAEWIINSNWQIISCNSNGSYTTANGMTIWPHDYWDNPIYELQP